MTSSPDVSIIIAAFNAQYHIARAITSALAQEGAALEVIVADDASTDATCAVVEGFEDPRVALVRCTVNGGPSAARDAALRVARGQWLAVLDADDAMTPGRLAGLIACARAHEADIVADNMQVDRDGALSLFIEEPLDGTVETIDLAGYARSNTLFSGAVSYGYLKPLLRAQFLRDHAIAYDPALRIGEDFMLVAEMLASGARYVRQRSAGYVYAVHTGSISHRLSAANAQAMADADRRFLARYAGALAPDALRAMQVHQRSLDDGASFTRLVDGLKARRWGAALREAAHNPAALRHLSMPLMARLRPSR